LNIPELVKPLRKIDQEPGSGLAQRISRSLALRLYGNAALEFLRYQIVNNRKPQTRSTGFSCCGKKGLEDFALNVGCNAAAVVAIAEMDLIVMCRHAKADLAVIFFSETMMNTIGNQIGNNLCKRPRIAVHGNGFIAGKFVDQPMLFE